MGKMKKTGRPFVSCLLSVVMALMMIPADAFATGASSAASTGAVASAVSTEPSSTSTTGASISVTSSTALTSTGTASTSSTAASTDASSSGPVVVAPQSSSAALDAALKTGGNVTAITSADATQWTQDASEAGRAFAKGSMEASASVTVDSPGWVVFDWKIGSARWQDKFAVSVDDTQEDYLLGGATSNMVWSTKVIRISGTGSQTITWTASTITSASPSAVGLDEINYVTASTAVTADNDGNGTATVTTPADASTAITAADPGSSVVFRATPKEGYLFEGWKTTPTDTGYVSTAAAYTTTVYDDPITLYACFASPFEGSGTEADPFQITTVADLVALDGFVSGGNTFAGAYFKVMNDITADATFTGIGVTGGKSFAGSFDGNGKTISGLTLSQGLFSNLSSAATVKDLTLDAAVTATASKAGIVAGTSSGTISGVTVKGSITSNYQDVGGIVGYLSSGSITGCASTATVSANANSYMGGIAGENSYNTSITNCYVGAKVDGGTVAAAVGGIIGKVGSTSTIGGNYVKADVCGNARIGGIAGWISGDGTVTNNGYVGGVTGVKNVGGLAGCIDGSSTSIAVTNSYAVGTVTATDAAGVAGGIVGYAEKACTITGDIALQSAVTATTAHRVVGSSVSSTLGGAPTLSGNYAFAGMTVNGAAVSSTDAASVEGADQTSAALRGSTTAAPYTSWDGTAWTVAAGSLPILTGVDATVQNGYPDYIAIELTDSDVSMATYRTYTTKAVEPDVTVTVNGTTLTKDTDYTVTYSDNTEIGTAATATVKGIGAYSGTVTKTFEIGTVWDGLTYETDWYNTTDTSFTITRTGQLAGISKLVNNGTTTFAGQAVTIGADLYMNKTAATEIDTTQNNLLPIAVDAGDNTYVSTVQGSFQGTLNGGGHTIYNLYAQVAKGTGYAGLFGFLDRGSVVKNLGVTGFVSGRVSGGIAASFSGAGSTSAENPAIESCYNACTVNGDGTGTRGTGGILGGNKGYGGTVINCYNAGAITNTYRPAGGIVGVGVGEAVSNCYSYGTITSSSGTGYEGAIMGTQNASTMANNYYLTGSAPYACAYPQTAGNALDSAALKAASPQLGFAYTINKAGTLNSGYPILYWQAGLSQVAATDLNVQVDDALHTGSAVTPEPTVTYNDTTLGETLTLKKGVDYTVSYANNIDIGTATVTITAIEGGRLTGSVAKTFRVADSEHTVTFSTGSGSAVAAQTVADGATVTQPDNPTYSGYVFGGWYTDETCTTAFDFATAVTTNTTLYAKWTVNTFAMDTIAGMTYTGGVQNPTVTVRDATTQATLAEGTDYTLSYKDASGASVAAADLVGAGTYTVTATGIGDYAYSDPASQTFAVAQKAVTVKANDKSKACNAADPDLDATVTGTLGTDSVAYTVGRAVGEDAGSYAITPTGDASQGNYSVTYQAGTLTITAVASQTREFPDGVIARLDGSPKSISDLVIKRRASASDAITDALGGRTLISDWDVYFTDGTTSGFGTLTLSFPAEDGTVQVWEVHSGKLTKGADQSVTDGRATASTTTLSEFAVTKARVVPTEPSAPTTTPATSVGTSKSPAVPATGDGELPLAPTSLACVGGCLFAVAMMLRRRSAHTG